jgi:hypothetical protein
MDIADASVLALLALADIALMVHLRRARGRRLLEERMMCNLRIALDREANAEASAPTAAPWTLRRAS